MKFKVGFTLAELMIVVGILGIVAALTIPNLATNHMKTVMLASIKSSYSMLGEALYITRAETFRGRFASSDFANVEGIKSFFGRNFNKEDCNALSDCFATTYKDLNGSSSALSLSGGVGVRLKNDNAIYIKPINDDGFATVYIDVNGTEKPNIGGRDMFTFNIYSDYSMDVISPDTIQTSDANSERETIFNDSCKSSTVGQGCIGRLINNDWSKMDY